MTASPLIDPQRSLLKDLATLAAEAAEAERQIEGEFTSRQQAVEREFRQARQQAGSRHAAERESAETDFAEAQARLTTEFEAARAATQDEVKGRLGAIGEEYTAEKQRSAAEFEEARWTSAAVCEAALNRAEAERRQAQEQVTRQRETLKSLQEKADRAAAEWGPEEDATEEVLPTSGATDADECIAQAKVELARLTGDTLPAFGRRRRRMIWASALVWLVATAPLPFLTGVYYWPAVGLVAAALAGFGAHARLVAITRPRVLAARRSVRGLAAEAEGLCVTYLERVKAQCAAERTAALERQARELQEAQERYQTRRAAIQERRDADWENTHAELRQRWAQIRERHDADLRESEERCRARLSANEQHYRDESQQLDDAYRRALEDNRKRRETSWASLCGRWRAGLDRAATLARDLNGACDRLFPSWDAPAWQTWAPPQEPPPVLRFGAYEVALERVSKSLPRDERLRSAWLAPFTLPACVPFPERGSVLLRARDEGRAAAVATLQALMLRLLTALPPGKVRFTIIDPVGLGQNFAAFMHLADYDEALVGSRIWTETAHIEQRLADLTGHMENVIQKYLRNQFQTIREYNAHAGEVAEPFRVVVVADFPVNFSLEAARRLVSIATSGPRCGVYTLLAVDEAQPVPQGFRVADLEADSAQLSWDGTSFVWKDPDFEPYPLRLDDSPPAELCNHLMQQVGESARAANRVEVPFDFIAPPPERWWQADSRGGLCVPLGRAGATKRQELRLGQGTAHHVLIAGKTGSGKSTLLHALITNLALCYSPDEVELYLVDFKKGVEFKTYAAERLPHARVVAIESEREFGLSVLQRLDAELTRRGELFRQAGAQNLAGYRAAPGRPPLPRVLLVVDEFQEFFVEDDRLAQEAARLLDRLVRQGRAFGLHVLLGSQTLGGANTLARATLDQMTVRIALQCSEADGHIILSEDNGAARLLSRPGEAIYNDANGLVEGNNPFQVVWLADELREDYLRRVRALDRAKARPLVVFEGDAPADVAGNYPLAELLRGAASPAERTAWAWLGEAVAIKPPTGATFRAQTDNHLLIIGQQDEAALGMLATALVSLAAQHPAGGAARFFVLDGTPDDSRHRGYWARMTASLPHAIRLGGVRDVPALMTELAAEVERRTAAGAEGAPWYVFVHGLHRFRDLRKAEDDFGFGRRGDEAPKPDQQFAAVLRDGPLLGVHALVWCDTLANLNRALDRQALRGFEMKVLMQMSATDSSLLIDTPLASKLGPYRAYFHSEDQGRLEKFRPYRPPPRGWLEEAGKLLAAPRPAPAGSAPVPQGAGTS
jgi:hypothetical protein